MTEMELREKFVRGIGEYYGCVQGDAEHRELLEYYNSNPNLPRGYRMTVNDPWCAATVSAIAVKLGLEGIVYPECSCSRMIQLYKSAGRWQEADSYEPEPGDLIMYNWADDGAGDCTGDPDHVGAVVRITDGMIRVIEGNMSGRLGYRDIPVNGRCIRGYCLPDYASLADGRRFEDVPDGKWYTEPIGRAVALGLMAGVSERRFGLGEPVTREQLAAVAVKLYELLSM